MMEKGFKPDKINIAPYWMVFPEIRRLMLLWAFGNKKARELM